MQRENIFISELNNKHFLHYGFFIESLLLECEVKELYDYLVSIDLKYNEGFNISFSHNDPKVRKEIDEFIKSKLLGKIDVIARNYNIFCAGLALKKNGKDSCFFLHTDDSICDEDNNIPFSIWIPLVDVNRTNGCLAVVAGSHKYTSVYRSTPFNEPILKYKDEFLKEYLIDINIKAGQALIFHPSLLHYSYDNLSGKDRPALIIACLPNNAEPMVVFNNKKLIFDKFYFYKLTKEMLYTWDWKSEPDSERKKRVYPIKKIPDKSILNHLKMIKEEFNNM